MLLEPAVADNVPLHVLLAPFGVATTSPETRVSEKATPVSAKPEFGLAMLNVTVEVPPTAMLVGKKALLMVGGLATVSVAVDEAGEEEAEEIETRLKRATRRKSKRAA